MKKIRRARVFLFLAAAFISGCLCSLTANAAVKSKNKIVVQEYSTAQKNAGELRIGILVSIFLIALILGFLGFWITRWLINRKTLGESNKKYGKKYSYKFKAPKDISEAASGKIKSPTLLSISQNSFYLPKIQPKDLSQQAAAVISIS